MELHREHTDFHTDKTQLSSVDAASMHAGRFASGYRALDRDFYVPTSLVSDIETMAAGDVISEKGLLNIAVKFFYSFVFDGAHISSVSFDDVAQLYELFVRHRSMSEPGDDPEVMHRVRMWSSALGVIANARRAACAMRHVIAAHEMSRGAVKTGVDAGCASGLLLVAAYIGARRAGAERIQNFGFNSDLICSERCHELSRALGVGAVLPIQQGRPISLGVLAEKEVHLVTDEWLLSGLSSLEDDGFFLRHESLQEVADLRRGVYVPEGIVAHCDSAGISVILTGHDGYGLPLDEKGQVFTPQAFLLNNEMIPAHKFGL